MIELIAPFILQLVPLNPPSPFMFTTAFAAPRQGPTFTDNIKLMRLNHPCNAIGIFDTKQTAPQAMPGTLLRLACASDRGRLMTSCTEEEEQERAWHFHPAVEAGASTAATSPPGW